MAKPSLPLLTTKLYIPPPRPRLVPRPHLKERLNAGLYRKLTLVSAPAGFGKTTMMADWVSSSLREVAWISLDEGDNDPVQFLNYLAAAFQQLEPTVGRGVQDLLHSPQLPPLEGVVATLINDVSHLSGPLILVLDDYQLVTETCMQRLVHFLLEHQPPTMHTVIITRQEPALPLARLRARGQVTEVGEQDLRFSPEEASAFLQQTMALTLSPEAVSALQSRTEGWVTGLQLAALALQKEEGVAAGAGAFAAAFAGDDRYVMDYLLEEVLRQQPEAVCNFVRRTSILERLTAPLCDAVLGIDEGDPIPGAGLPAATSQSILDYLERANLFVVCLDNRREWYRYHRLFGEALRAGLAQAEKRGLHRRALAWYEARRLHAEAIRHALAYGRVPGSLDDAERLIRLAAEETLLNGGVLAVRGWLDALPDERVRGAGELATYMGWSLALTDDMARAAEYATAAENTLRQAQAKPVAGWLGPQADGDGKRERPGWWGKLLVLRGFLAVMLRQEYGEAIELSSAALEVLAQDQADWQIFALWILGEAQERTGDIAQAVDTLHQAAQLGYTLGSRVFAAAVVITLIAALNSNGRRREAVAVARQALAHFGEEASLPAGGLVHSRLGLLYYEADELAQARRSLEQALAQGEQLALPSYLIAALCHLPPVLYAQGEIDAAMATLQQGYQVAVQTGLTDAEWFRAWEANLHLRQGNLPSALRWAEATGLSIDDSPQYLHFDSHLVYARVLLAQGRLSDARRWLARLEAFAQGRGLHRWLITIYVLQALAAHQAHDEAIVRERLTRGLELAAPEDYVRAFLDEDARLMALLPGVREVAPNFVDLLLHKTGQVPPRPIPASAALIEPLTERETEVLGLIAAGLTNREIAQELVIAVGTVKRHINNLYGKLDAHSRTQAVARARELGLL
jgi:LuxR family maltose regulon positive regulatory protein